MKNETKSVMVPKIRTTGPRTDPEVAVAKRAKLVAAILGASDVANVSNASNVNRMSGLGSIKYHNDVKNKRARAKNQAHKSGNKHESDKENTPNGSNKRAHD